MHPENGSRKIILVNEQDKPIGESEKLAAHQNGAKLHRAFSIFIFNLKDQTLLQKRASTKYHSQNKWTNTCCSHPYVGESILHAAHRRLKEEMGFDSDNMQDIFSFVYRAKVGNGLTEYEYDHVLFANYDGKPALNPEEAKNYKWVSLKRLKEELKKNPSNYTPWLRLVIDKVIEHRI